MSGLNYFTKGLDKEAKAYVDHVILRIAASWDTQELIRHVSPEFLQNMPPQKIDSLFDTLSKLIGQLEEYKGAKGNINISISSEGKPIVIGGYIAEAVFENGPAKIQLQMIRQNNTWQIESFLIIVRVNLRGGGSLPC